jgi:hypothetical protein
MNCERAAVGGTDGYSTNDKTDGMTRILGVLEEMREAYLSHGIEGIPEDCLQHYVRRSVCIDAEGGQIDSVSAITSSTAPEHSRGDHGARMLRRKLHECR